MSLSSDRLSRREALQRELAELENETEGDVDAIVSDAEQAVMKTAETSTKGVDEATETLAQAEQDIAESVEVESEKAAKELGRPDLADEIADRLFQRIEERGLLPSPAPSSVPEAEQVAEGEAEKVESSPAQAQAAVGSTVEEDSPPEPQHWFYRRRFKR